MSCFNSKAAPLFNISDTNSRFFLAIFIFSDIMEMVIYMLINNLRPVEICGVHTVFSKKGTHDTMKNRRYYGFLFADRLYGGTL